jgi:hypothetical protein
LQVDIVEEDFLSVHFADIFQSKVVHVA